MGTPYATKPFNVTMPPQEITTVDQLVDTRSEAALTAAERNGELKQVDWLYNFACKYKMLVMGGEAVGYSVTCPGMYLGGPITAIKLTGKESDDEISRKIAETWQWRVMVSAYLLNKAGTPIYLDESAFTTNAKNAYLNIFLLEDLAPGFGFGDIDNQVDFVFATPFGIRDPSPLSYYINPKMNDVKLPDSLALSVIGGQIDGGIALDDSKKYRLIGSVAVGQPTDAFTIGEKALVGEANEEFGDVYLWKADVAFAAAFKYDIDTLFYGGYSAVTEREGIENSGMSLWWAGAGLAYNANYYKGQTKHGFSISLDANHNDTTIGETTSSNTRFGLIPSWLFKFGNWSPKLSAILSYVTSDSPKEIPISGKRKEVYRTPGPNGAVGGGPIPTDDWLIPGGGSDKRLTLDAEVPIWGKLTGLAQFIMGEACAREGDEKSCEAYKAWMLGLKYGPGGYSTTKVE